MRAFLTGFLVCCLSLSVAKASVSEDNAVFEKIFAEWTDAFNQQQLQASCSLFAKSLVASYRGAPKKNYESICSSFQRLFQQKESRYQYQFKIHDVYRNGDLAAVRITWYLVIYKDNKKLSTTQDEGIDIFKRNQSGQWQIINYLAYPV